MSEIPDRVLRFRDVRHFTGLSRATIWRLVRDGRFPAPFDLSGPQAKGWSENAIRQWIADRAARRPLGAEREQHTA